MTREFQTIQIIPLVVRVELDHSHHVEGKNILEDTSGAEVLTLKAPMAAAATRWQTPLRFRPGKQTDVVVEMGCAGRKQESQTVRIFVPVLSAVPETERRVIRWLTTWSGGG